MAAFSTAALTAFLLFLLHLRGGNGKTPNFSDPDYVGLALNLEYLETEFFLFGALGHGLDEVDKNLTMGGPSPIGPMKVNFSNSTTKDIIEQFGWQEVGHLRAIKAAIDKKDGFPRPLLNLSATTFANIMNSAFGVHLSPPFNPYANEINFLIASYLIPYVGLTGYVGAAKNLQHSKFKSLVAGLLGVESGQDAIIRALLFQHAESRVPGYKYTVAQFTEKISNLRNKLGGDGVKDEGIIVKKPQGAEGKVTGNVLAGDKHSLAYGRSPDEILDIVYGSGSPKKCGGFFPYCANGTIANFYLRSNKKKH